MKKRDKCIVCDEKIKSPLLDLPKYPITETYVKEPVNSADWIADQEFQYCENCGNGQLSNVLPQEKLYGNVYRFRTSKSVWGATKGNDYFSQFVNQATQGKTFKRIIEIGCNDAYLLENLKGKANELIGVDPVLKNDSRGNIKLIGDFYENTNLKAEDSLIITHQVIEHLEDPKGLLKEVMKTANKNTTCVFGFPSLEYLTEDYRFDQIFHHHLNYFSEKSSMRLLDEVGAQCFSKGWNPHYWGTLILTFGLAQGKNPEVQKISSEKLLHSFELFQQKMSNLEEFIKNSRELYCYGAGLQLPVLNYHAPSLDKKAKGIIDDDESKDGLGYPNLQTKIVKNKEGLVKDKDVIITAMNFSRGILPNLFKQDPHRVYLPFNALS